MDSSVKRRSLLPYIGLVFGAILCVCFLAFIVVVFFFFSEAEEEFVGEEIHKYKYYKYDTNTDVSSHGFVSIYNDLGEDEYLSYHDDDGNYYLISPFDSGEYHCTATCSCEGERRSSKAISLGLTYLVAAASSLIAYEKAKTYFEKACEEEVPYMCRSNSKDYSIFVEVDGCIERTKEPLSPGGEDWTGKSGIHYCSGNCMTRKGIKNPRARVLAPKMKCVTLFELKQIEVDPKTELEDVKEMFKKDYLIPYCEKEGGGAKIGLKENNQICVGVDDEGNNESIVCTHL